MPQQGRLAPNERGRTIFSLRGRVTKHITLTRGVWIWKETKYAIGIDLYPDQLEEVQRRFGRWIRTPCDSFHMEFPKKVAWCLSQEERDSFAEEIEVAVTFGLSGVIDQYFTGTTPLEVLRVVKTDGSAVIENEILPVQLHLV